MGAADASVLGEADAGPGQELSSFDLTGRCFDQLAKLPPLLFGDRSRQILNLRDPFPDEGHDGHLGDAADPGVADQLQIQSGQALRLLRVTSRGGLPFQQTLRAIQISDGIDVGHELAAARE